jgi:hypothetical protein
MLYSIPAHKSLISHVKFEPQEGHYLATSSYDTRAAVCFLLSLGQFNHFPLFSSLILNTFLCSYGQLGTTNQSKVWQDMSRKLLVWILVEVIICLSTY